MLLLLERKEMSDVSLNKCRITPEGNLCMSHRDSQRWSQRWSPNETSSPLMVITLPQFYLT